MRNTYRIACLTAILGLSRLTAHAQPAYFPPATPADTTWTHVAPGTLGWNRPALDSLLTFVGQGGSRSFLILYNGRLVTERYYGTYTRDSVWAWNSAGKTLTALLVGIARQEGRLTLDDSVSRHLGLGWTSCSLTQEGRITLRHLLTMTSGLNPAPSGNGSASNANLCSTPACLQYFMPAGTRWLYHTGAYRRLEDVVTAVGGGASYSALTLSRVGIPTGLRGLWVNSVFYSNARSMARFGLLLLNQGTWNTTAVVRDTAYLRFLTTPSQAFNPAYGLLTWLNGGNTFLLPSSPVVQTGSLIPSAPADLYAALGKDDQKIYVAPSRRLVVVRQGLAANASVLGPSSFDEELWARLMRVIGQPTGLTKSVAPTTNAFYPSPATATVRLTGITTNGVELYDTKGRLVRTAPVGADGTFSVSGLAPGLYAARAGGRALGRLTVAATE